MFDWYFMSANSLLLYEAVLILLLVLQMLYLVLHMYRPLDSSRFIAEKVCDYFILFLYFFLLIEITVIDYNQASRVVIRTRYDLYFYLLFAGLAICSLAAFGKNRKVNALLPMLFALPALPCWQAGPYAVYLFNCSLLLLGLYSGSMSYFYYRTIRANLSVLSIKEAVDMLPTGILFYQQDGHVLLVNSMMQELLQLLFPGRQRDGKRIFAALETNTVDTALMRFSQDNSFVYELANNQIIRFKLNEVIVGRKTYYQLTAADITEEWRLTLALEKQTAQLTKRKQQLLEMFADLENLVYRQELVRQKDKIHDIMGQNIALIQTLLRQDKPDPMVISDAIQQMKADLHKEPPDQEPPWQSMLKTYRAAGIEIQLEGDLPQTAKDLPLYKIARESITNAVRHGAASKITVKYLRQAQGDLFTVTNNGMTLAALIEGSGIKGMRRQAQKLGGHLFIQNQPLFTVAVQLAPRLQEVTYVQNLDR